MFSLDQLRGFVTVAQELHYGRAAERLHMTQPALSRQIQSLERYVEVRLLERDNRGVELTPAGEAFLVEAHRLLTLAHSAPRHARRVAAGQLGAIRVGFTAAATFEVLPALIDHVATTVPALDLHLREMVTRDQIAGLRSEEVDIALARPPFDCRALASRLVKREDLVAVVPAHHHLAVTGRPVEVSALAGEPLVMHSPGRARYLYDLVVRHLPVDHQNVVHTVDQILTMVSLVAVGRGLALVPRSAERLGIPGVRYLPISGVPEKPVEMYLVWPREPRNPAVTHALRSLRDFHLA